ncbi:MAG: glycosyltransferase, partial [Microcoleus sp. SIO2G3]|nr:glycosyltransferase [Microcoleus sp. SIO2G3]
MARCLASLAAQTLPPSDYEVVVADDAASDATRAQVEAVAASVELSVR